MDRDGRILLRKGGGRRLLFVVMRLRYASKADRTSALPAQGCLIFWKTWGELFAWYSEAICVEYGRVEYRGNCSEGCALTLPL